MRKLILYKSGRMKNNAQNVNIIRRTARILSIAFAAFISIFAMDVFSENYGPLKTMIDLFMHLIPSFLVILILIFSWQREWIGGVVYTVLGIFYIIYTLGKFEWSAYALISGPLFILGILFFISWCQRKKQHV